MIEIDRVWAAELEILDVIHDFCIKNDIKYSLFYGSLLGAVRHGGFIPWDDDIDIAMPREEYRRFRKLWLADPPTGYLLQDYYTDRDYTNNFMKIRKDNTTFLEDEEERTKKFHKGFFVDIFPLDRVAPSKIGKRVQYAACAVNLLFTRGYCSGTRGVTGIVEKVLLKLPEAVRRKLAIWSEIIITSWNKDTTAEFVSACTMRASRWYYSNDMFSNIKTVQFSGKEYMSVHNADDGLARLYGDYMQLPPENERVWKHHPLLVDFSRNYEDIPESERNSM